MSSLFEDIHIVIYMLFYLKTWLVNFIKMTFQPFQLLRGNVGLFYDVFYFCCFYTFALFWFGFGIRINLLGHTNQG
jgi:hypothetical protein